MTSDETEHTIATLWPALNPEQELIRLELIFGKDAAKDLVGYCGPLATTFEMTPAGMGEMLQAVARLVGFSPRSKSAVLVFRRLLWLKYTDLLAREGMAVKEAAVRLVKDLQESIGD